MAVAHNFGKLLYAHITFTLYKFIDLEDLDYVITILRDVPKKRWQDLGLKFGIHKSTLEIIEADYSKDVESCFRECLTCWLRRQDNVDNVGKPTLSRLAEVLEDIGDKATAGKIREKGYYYT